MFPGLAMQLHTPAAFLLRIPFVTLCPEDPLIHQKALAVHIPIDFFVCVFMPQLAGKAEGDDPGQAGGRLH